MNKKIIVKGILSALLILSLLVNLSYLEASESKHRYLKETIPELHEEFTSAVYTLYMNLNQIEDSDFKEKEYINDELEEAIGKVRSCEKMMRRIDSLSDEFNRFHHYDDVYMFLVDLEQKDTFTKEDLQRIKEIYSTASIGSKDITKRKFLYRLTPTEAYINMSGKIGEICIQAGQS